jgi:DNA repair protein SbcD/Mre11
MREGVDCLKRVKLLHCGDLHLDAPFTSLADRDGMPEQRRQELKRMLGRIINLAVSENVDLLLLCGDLYEHGYVRKSTFHFIYEQFRKIPNLPVIIIPGNHDPLSPDSLYSRCEWPENVHILKNRTDFYEHTLTGTRVSAGMPQTSSTGEAVASHAVSLLSTRGGINILLHHGTLDMAFSSDAYQPVSSAELDELGFDYCALGHFHSVIRGAGRSERIFNAGSPEPLGFDEEGEHGVFIVTIEKKEDEESRIHADFRRIGQRRFINLEVQVGGCLTDEQAVSAVVAAVEGAGGADDLYSVTLQGYVNRNFRVDTAYLLELLKDKAFYIKINDRTMPDYDFGSIAGEPGLRGLFVRKMLDRAANAIDEEGRQLVMKALYYGIEAIDEGSVCV